MKEYDIKAEHRRITAIVGHYGSGKSELAVNYALKLAEENRVMLFDLDIVNPYFRSRECEDLLTSAGIKVGSSAEAFRDVDLPYMPPELSVIFQNKEITGVMDIGGDPAGARVLARYAENLNRAIEEGDGELWCVLNGNRPMTKTAEAAAKYVTDISLTAGVPITGLINNTHLLNHTTREDVERGIELTCKVSELTGIPVVFSSVKRSIADGMLTEAMLTDGTLGYNCSYIFPMDIYLKKPWE